MTTDTTFDDDAGEYVAAAATLTLHDARQRLAGATSLGELLTTLHGVHAGLSDDDLACLDLSDLPIFGGEAPDDTHGVWSWDEQSLLIGAGWDDWEIVDRDDVAAACAAEGCAGDDDPHLDPHLVAHAAALLRAFPQEIASAARDAPRGNSTIGGAMVLTLRVPRWHAEAAVCAALAKLPAQLPSGAAAKAPPAAAA